MNLAVGVPITWPYIATSFFTSYVGLFKPAQLMRLQELGVDKIYDVFNRNFPIDKNRNEICKAALDMNCEYLLFLDADMTFPKDLVVKLVEADKDIVSGIYFKKKAPYPAVPSNFRDDDSLGQALKPIEKYEKGLVKADVVGGGCLLIRRNVLEAMEHPWFEYEIDQRTNERAVTEDIGFCRKAKKCGFDIWVDTRLVCGHIAPRIIDENTGKEYRGEQ